MRSRAERKARFVHARVLTLSWSCHARRAEECPSVWCSILASIQANSRVSSVESRICANRAKKPPRPQPRSLGGSHSKEMSEENSVKSYVVVHNIAKRHNVGTLARSATAFGVSELILVGRRDFNAFGSHGSTSHLRFRHFFSLLDARNFLKERDCDICGVEITDNAFPVNQHPFKRSTAFLLGNEGTGLSTKELEICDFFVYIPQYGWGTASLNVTVAASIVLHHFAVWAGFPERTREGNKFVVAERPARQTRRSFCAESEDAVIEERRIRRENAANEFFSENADDAAPANLLNTLFDDAEENNIDFDSCDKLCIASG